MNKLLFFIGLVFVCNTALATPDYIQPTEYTVSQQVDSTPGTVYGINVSYIGATAGDYIQLVDGIGGAGSVRFTCVASASAGMCIGPYNQSAAYFGTGIYYRESKPGVFKTDIQSF